MVKPSATLPVADQLDHYFRQIERAILVRQHPLTGLFPASTAVSSHGDYTDAWVRDNVYVIQSVWALGIAYRKNSVDSGRAYLLEQSVVKMMRGLLLAMMRQADKVERFKRSRRPYDALHAKYDLESGDPVVADHEWGHLQLDATALFVLMLAQMIRSGLRIIYSIDEVNFIQNLTYYLGRAYRTPDFGIWERGHKHNDGRAEINASSLGMVKAALEAVRGINLFGDDRYQESVIHVVSDEIAQTRVALENLLPRESNSKEIDAALLSIIGYPAFAVEDKRLVRKTEKRILKKLGGNYGCKRFLLDGHQTVLEDTNRLHYELTELRKFEHIESEWPLFFTYLHIAALFRGDFVEAARYRRKLEALCVECNGIACLPELYYVAQADVEAEKQNPGSQKRVANNNVPLLWAQSLYYLGCLIDDGLLVVDDIDPLHRHNRIARRKRVQVQIALLAEDGDVQKRLSASGFVSETREQLSGISVKEGRELSRVFNYIGVNSKLQLGGRPMRRMRAMMSSQVYRIRDELYVFIPQFQNQHAFYLNLDNHILIDQVVTELHYLQRHWDQTGKPLMTLAVNSAMLQAEDGDVFIEFLKQLSEDRVPGVSIAFGPLSELIHHAGRETIKEMHDFAFIQQAGQLLPKSTDYLRFDETETSPVVENAGSIPPLQPVDEKISDLLNTSGNLYRHIDLLSHVLETQGSDYELSVGPGGKKVSAKKLLEEIYRKACDRRIWGVVRQASGLLDKYYDRLDIAVQEMAIRQKQVMVGRSHNSSTVITEILTSREIYNQIRLDCENDVRETQLNQEVLALLGGLVKSRPELFDGIITVRAGQLLLLCVSEFAEENGLEDDRAFEAFAGLSPYCIQQRLELVLSHYQKAAERFSEIGRLQYVRPDSDLVFLNFTEDDDPEKPEQVTDWQEWRRNSGTIAGLPGSFYVKLWKLLACSKGVVIGDRYNIRSRLDSAYIIGAMTAGERSFALLVDSVLSGIYSPEYRYLTIETISAIAAFIEVNPGLRFDDYLVLDAVTENALRHDWLSRYPGREQLFNEDNSSAWEMFYQSPPHYVADAVIRSLERLLLSDRVKPARQRTTVGSGQSLSL